MKESKAATAEETTLPETEKEKKPRLPGAAAQRTAGEAMIPEGPKQPEKVLFGTDKEITSVTIPGTVKTITAGTFAGCEKLTDVHLSEGLEKIESAAFGSCAIREIAVPSTVREICTDAFNNCRRLKKVTLSSSSTQIDFKAFSFCEKLTDLSVHGTPIETDRFFHAKGLPFLIQHLEDPANLDHKASARFAHLTEKCAKGDAAAMNELAKWFERIAHKPGASAFYLRAAGYWRYRAYERGNPQAVQWFSRFFKAHPGERLESILPECRDHNRNVSTHSLSGSMLNDLGYPFFHPKEEYEIKQFLGKNLVTVSSYDGWDGPDEDGYGGEDSFTYWFLDENLQPIPGIRCVTASYRETDFPFFTSVRDQAIQNLEQRRRHNSI